MNEALLLRQMRENFEAIKEQSQLRRESMKLDLFSAQYRLGQVNILAAKAVQEIENLEKKAAEDEDLRNAT